MCCGVCSKCTWSPYVSWHPDTCCRCEAGSATAHVPCCLQLGFGARDGSPYVPLSPRRISAAQIVLTGRLGPRVVNGYVIGCSRNVCAHPRVAGPGAFVVLGSGSSCMSLPVACATVLLIRAACGAFGLCLETPTVFVSRPVGLYAD